MKRRFFGLPVPIIAVVLAVALVSSGALAAFLMTRTIPSTVTVIGVDAAEVYEDEACTIPLTALDFSDIMPGEATDPEVFWVKNESDSNGPPFYVGLSWTGLDPLLDLFQGITNAVPEDPTVLAVVVSESALPDVWQETSTTTYVYAVAGMDESQTSVELAGSLPAPGVVKIDDELIYFATSGGGFIDGCVRGYEDTLAAAHANGATATLMELVSGGTEPVYELNPGEKVGVTVHIEADPGISRNGKAFDIIVQARDTAF